MERRVRTILVVVLLGTVVVAGVASTVAARPPPRPVCGVCGESLFQADRTAPPPAIERSSASIRVDRNGTGHWTARTELAAPADLDRERVRQAAIDQLEADGPAETYRNVRVTVEDRTVTVRFSVPDVAHRGPGGVLVVDHFYWAGDSGRWFVVDADRVTVTGPDGTVPVERPGVGTAGDGAVVWTGDDVRTLPERTFLAFASDDGPATVAAANLAIGLDVTAAKAPDVPGLAALPAAVLAGFVALLVLRGDLVVGRSLWRRLATGVATAVSLAGASVVGGALLESGAAGPGARLSEAAHELLFAGLFGVPLSALVIGITVPVAYALVRIAATRLETSPRRAVVRTGVALVGLGLLLAPVTLGSDGGLARAVAFWTAALTPFLFLSLGAVVGRDRTATAGFAAAIVCSSLLLAVGVAPVGGFTATYLPVWNVPWALVAGVAGVVAFDTGRTLAVDPPEEGPLAVLADRVSGLG